MYPVRLPYPFTQSSIPLRYHTNSINITQHNQHSEKGQLTVSGNTTVTFRNTEWNLLTIAFRLKHVHVVYNKIKQNKTGCTLGAVFTEVK